MENETSLVASAARFAFLLRPFRAPNPKQIAAKAAAATKLPTTIPAIAPPDSPLPSLLGTDGGVDVAAAVVVVPT